jgi:hypothetical protein
MHASQGRHRTPDRRHRFAPQMQKHSSRGGGEEGQDTRYAGHDASFHTAEWHAARLAALQMERPRWGNIVAVCALPN